MMMKSHSKPLIDEPPDGKWFQLIDEKAELPEWARQIFRSNDGAVDLFSICDLLVGQEEAVTFFEALGKVSVILHREHLYVPLAWIKEQHPELLPKEIADFERALAKRGQS